MEDIASFISSILIQDGQALQHRNGTRHGLQTERGKKLDDLAAGYASSRAIYLVGMG